MSKKRILYLFLFSFFLLNPSITFSQNGKIGKLQTYQLDKPHIVEKIVRQKNVNKPKNIILMIGDGMSLSTLYTAWVANRGQLNIENCEYTGLSKTYSASDLITDSGAGGTAIAIGYKTKNGYVGVDANEQPRLSILEIANINKLSTGLVVTCNILDATPSDFIAKINDRDKWDEIALQYVNNEVDFVCGGGWENFKHKNDRRDLINELAGKGYQIPNSVEELEKITEGKVFALIAKDALPPSKIRGEVLSNTSEKAIEILNKNEKGFFLMIEGSMIDDGGHNNNLEQMIDETLDFDKAIGKVLKWAAEDGQTLVVITADHECGGWTLLDGDINKGKVEGIFSTDSHSGVMVPVYSFGPGAEKFTGIFENTDLFKKMKEAFGFNN